MQCHFAPVPGRRAGVMFRRLLTVSLLVLGCSSPPTTAIEREKWLERPEPRATGALSSLASWVGVYRHEGSHAIYTVTVHARRGLFLARVRSSGWQVSDDLLCRVRQTGTDRLEIVFEKHGSAAGMANEYEVGDVVVTLVRAQGKVSIEWGKFPDPGDFESAYPKPLSKRLDRLLGRERGRFEAFSAMTSGDFGVQSGDLIFMYGMEPHGGAGQAGLVHDTRRNELHAFIYDSECSEHVEVWSENWNHVTPQILDWMKSFNDPPLPIEKRWTR